MLSWFDEPPTLLRQAVRGAATICDRLVAADGGYWLVSDKRSTSPPSQRRAIRDAAKECGIEVEFLTPQIWPGQVTKRNAVLQVAKEGSDWVLTLDADWKISGERAEIRDELEQMLLNGYEQVEVNFVTPDDPSRPDEVKIANEWHLRQKGTQQWLAFLYRVQSQMEYRKNHWSLYCEGEFGRKVGLFGAFNDLRYERAKTGRLQTPHVFEHLCLFRDRKQIERNGRYIVRRDQQAVAMGFET